MTDDSGRESREPARAAENAVDAVLREVGYGSGLGALPLMVEQSTTRIVQRAIDDAYAQGALDMRTRAAAVARNLGGACGRKAEACDLDATACFWHGKQDGAESAADSIEALDVEVPR